LLARNRYVGNVAGLAGSAASVTAFFEVLLQEEYAALNRVMLDGPQLLYLQVRSVISVLDNALFVLSNARLLICYGLLYSIVFRRSFPL